MSDSDQEALRDTVNRVCSIISICFRHAAKSDDFEASAVDGLVKYAQKFEADRNEIALQAIIGALYGLSFTYVRRADIAVN